MATTQQMVAVLHGTQAGNVPNMANPERTSAPPTSAVCLAHGTRVYSLMPLPTPPPPVTPSPPVPNPPILDLGLCTLSGSTMVYTPPPLSIPPGKGEPSFGP